MFRFKRLASLFFCIGFGIIQSAQKRETNSAAFYMTFQQGQPSNTPMFDEMSASCMSRTKSLMMNHHQYVHYVNISQQAIVAVSQIQLRLNAYNQHNFVAIQRVISNASIVQQKHQSLCEQVKSNTTQPILLVEFNQAMKSELTQLRFELHNEQALRADLMQLTPQEITLFGLQDVCTINEQSLHAIPPAIQTYENCIAQSDAVIKSYIQTTAIAEANYKNNSIDVVSHTEINESLIPSLQKSIESKELSLSSQKNIVAQSDAQLAEIHDKIVDLENVNWFKYHFSSRKGDIKDLRTKQESLLRSKALAESQIKFIGQELNTLKHELVRLEKLVAYGKNCEKRQHAIDLAKVQDLYQSIHSKGQLDSNGQKILEALKNSSVDSKELHCEISNALIPEAIELLAFCNVAPEKFEAFKGNAFQKHLFGQVVTVLNNAGKRFVENRENEKVCAYVRAAAQSSVVTSEVIRQGYVHQAIALTNLVNTLDQMSMHAVAGTVLSLGNDDSAPVIEQFKQFGGLLLGAVNNDQELLAHIEKICGEFAQLPEQQKTIQATHVLKAFIAPNEAAENKDDNLGNMLSSIENVINIETGSAVNIVNTHSHDSFQPSYLSLDSIKDNNIQHRVEYSAAPFFSSWNGAVKDMWKSIVSFKLAKQMGNASTTHRNILQGTSDAGLIKAFDQMRQDFGAVHTKTYVVKSESALALARLGIDIHPNAFIEFTGNHVQHHIQGQLIESLNRIGLVPQRHAQVNGLLKTAADFNNTGQHLVRGNHIEHAINARIACDKILDLGWAILDEGFEAAQSALLTSAKFTAGAIELAFFDKEAIGVVKNSFTDAASAITKFVETYYVDIALVASGVMGAPSMVAYRHREDTTHFVEGLQKIWIDASPPERAKMISRFVVEWECFGAIGSIAGQAARVAIVTTSNVIKDFALVEALSAEATDLMVQVIGKDSALVSGSVEIAQQEAKMLANMSESISSVGQGTGKALAESQTIVEAESKIVQAITQEVKEGFKAVVDIEGKVEYLPIKCPTSKELYHHLYNAHVNKRKNLVGGHMPRKYPELISEVIAGPNEQGIKKLLLKKGNLVSNPKTVGPDHWNQVDYARFLKESYQNIIKKAPYRPGVSKLTGIDSNGISWELFIECEDGAYKLTTGYPLL